MRESQTVLGWIDEGRTEGQRQALRLLLSAKFGPLPPEWLDRIEAVDDPASLEAALLAVLRVERLEDLTL